MEALQFTLAGICILFALYYFGRALLSAWYGEKERFTDNLVKKLKELKDAKK